MTGVIGNAVVILAACEKSQECQEHGWPTWLKAFALLLAALALVVFLIASLSLAADWAEEKAEENRRSDRRGGVG